MFTSGTLEREQARNGAMSARLSGLALSAPLVAFSPGTPKPACVRSPVSPRLATSQAEGRHR